MSKEVLGIYIGETFAAAVRLSGKKIVASSKCNVSSLEEDIEGGIIKRDVLWEALINKVLREVQGDATEAFVSLEDKEFIYRCFDMPLMNRKEIESAVKYEIEKYIPFKIEELSWSYDYTKIVKDKKINLSFVGIKKIALERYFSLFRGTNIKILNMEPAALGLMRIISFLKFKRKKANFILLDFSPSASYITFFYNNLPIFNRLLGSYDEKGKDAVGKMIDEVRISVQYFRREFKSYALNKLFIVGSRESEEMLSSIKKEIDIDSEVIVTDKILNMKGAGIEHLKAYGAAASSFIPFRFKLSFIDRERGGSKKEIVAAAPNINYVFLGGLVLIGIVGCIFFYSILNNKLSLKSYEIKKEIEKMQLPPGAKEKNIDYFENSIHEKENKVNQLKSIFGEIKTIGPLLEAIPEIIPNGMWFSGFSFENADKSMKLSITGHIFLGSKEEEARTLDDFISSLKENKNIRLYFSKVNIVSISRENVEGYDCLKFSVELE